MAADQDFNCQKVGRILLPDLSRSSTNPQMTAKRTKSKNCTFSPFQTTRNKMQPRLAHRLVICVASLLASTLLISNLALSANAKYGVEATSGTTSNLASDRVHVIRQPANHPGGTHRSGNKNYKEIYDHKMIHVKENTPIGSRLYEVFYRDSDQPQSNPSNQHQIANGGRETLYAIVAGTDMQAFTLRNENGKVELVNEVEFDYETDKKIYSVSIRVMSVHLKYDLDVDILIVDENDNKPRLDDFAIVFNNYKNNFPTGPIGRIPAVDLDVNDVLRYRVLSGNNAQLIIVNETNGDIQLSPWLNSNVPLRAVMEVAVSDGINEAIAKLVLTVNLVTESMLQNSVTVRLDGLTRDEFLSKKYDVFLTQMARVLGTSNSYGTVNIVVFDVEQSNPNRGQKEITKSSSNDARATSDSQVMSLSSKATPDAQYSVSNVSQPYVNVTFAARADGNDVEAYLSRQYVEERIFLNRITLSQNLEASVAPFQDDVCVQEPCLNYQECRVTHKFDIAPKTFILNSNMIFRQIKTSQGYACVCPPTFTGMKNKLECNLQINQCFTNPCLNGGLCHRHESGYTCECRGEFFGPRCEHSFTNSTCESIATTRSHGFSPMASATTETATPMEFISDVANSINRQSTLIAATTCSGKSRCINLNKSHQFYYSKLASPTTSISAASSSSTGGFACQGCPYQSQWSTDLCQLRARSFEKQTYIVLPSLRRRHSFHLALQFNTFQSDAVIMYNGRYNDRHDFIALEIVDSRLRFTYSLGEPGQISSVSLSSIPVSDGQWHKVAVEYRDRNVTLILDDCDPVLDEALAKLEPSALNRCSNTSIGVVPISYEQTNPGGVYRMLDLTSPMHIGSIPPSLMNSISVESGDTILTGQSDELSSSKHLASLTNTFAGCISDLYVDHQLVDLSAPLQDMGTQPGCPERRNLCQLQQCNGNLCQESYGSAKCQCGEDRIGRSCEQFLSQDKIRRFTGNSYLAFNPTDALVPNQWLVSLYFRSLNPSGVIFKIYLDSDVGIMLELLNSGLKLTYRSRSLYFNKIPLDDDEWHFVEIAWSTIGTDLNVGSTTTSLQVDHNANLVAQTNDLGPIAGSTMRLVVVGSSSTRYNSPSFSAANSPSLMPAAANPSPLDPAATSSVTISDGGGTSTPPSQPPAVAPVAAALTSSGTPDDYVTTFNSSSVTFVGCIFGFNMSDNAEWWQSALDERNVERGCPVTDPCETKQCPANSRCIRKGINQRKCLCNPGFVGEFCMPVCELHPCKGDNSKCISAANIQTMTQDGSKVGGGDTKNHQQQGLHYTCECESNRSGKNCEHQLSQRCPSNWWGKPQAAGQNYSICGPCNCDESKGFDGDCDKLNGDCYCKPNHYQPPGSDYCLACDCYSVGSLSTSCNQTTGQCTCRPGVVGRRCDSCASQYAEVTLRGCEVTYDPACPKTYSDGIWWEKIQLDRLAQQPCPVSTSTGTATRLCHKTEGWQRANLFDCISNTFTDLYTQYQFLEENKFQMTTNLAMKIASNLKMALNETISSPSMQLYGTDMYISFSLLHHLIQHESRQTGLNLTHRQDRAYIRNIVESISYILDPAYADNWPEIAARFPHGGAEYLLKLMDSFGKVLIVSQSDTYTQPFEIVTKHMTFGMDTLSIDQLYDMSKWSLGSNGGLGAAINNFNSPASMGGSFPSSPPYATDPFDSPLGPLATRQSPMGAEPIPSGHFNPDGTSIYLDYSATRDASPSVLLPKYDNYPALVGDWNDSSHMQHIQSRVLLPLKTLRMRQPKEIMTSGTGGSHWAIMGAARSRAKRDELIIPDYASIRSQRQPIAVYSIYKTLGPLLPAEFDNSVQNRLGVLAMANSPVVWLTVRPQNSTDFLGKNIHPKITYMLKTLEPLGKTRPQCAIWDFVAPQSSTWATQTGGSVGLSQQRNSTSEGGSTSPSANTYGIKKTGRFTTRGCEVKGVHPNHRLRSKFDYVNCSCDHLGAVIVLMDNSIGNSDFLLGDESASLAEMSLVVSLWLSLAIMVITLFILTCIRGHSIKSNSNSINKNLLIILIIIESLILYSTLLKGSLNQRPYQCQLVAIFLHYFSISLFFWLLVNAIHFYRMLTELRDINHGPMKFYHVLGYAVPAFFVSIAVGLRIEQFGNYLFCWLSIHEPIIWSMFGPISLVTMLTIILFKFALCKSLPLNKMVDNQEDSNGVDLIRTHMLINSVKTPLIGIYWLIAVYAVNETLSEFSYLFPLAILSKSLLLFVLFCIVDKHIRYNLYVSWLRFKGEKVPFVDDHMITYGNYGLDGPTGPNNTSQQWMISMMNQDDRTAYGGLNGTEHNETGQMLYPNQQQVLTPGFQSSCTDIFRPELLDGTSAASTTSRSSTTGTSSSAQYREYRRTSGHHTHRKVVANDESDNDDDDQDGYGRARRHRRRHGNGKRSHRKHHHHGGRHHHHHHHRHRSHHQDDYTV